MAAMSSDKRFNAFLAAFPMDDPQYVVLTVVDEPKPGKPGMGATAGLNAAPMVGDIIRRRRRMLGVKPEFGHEDGATLARVLIDVRRDRKRTAPVVS